MRVAMLGPCPVPPAGGEGQPAREGGQPLAGGVDAAVLALARSLARQPGIQVDLVTAIPGLREPCTLPGDGYAVHCVPRPRLGRLLGQRPVLNNLRRAIEAVAPDVVHAHIAGIYAAAALASGRPALVTLHGVIRREAEVAWPSSNWPARLRWWMDARFEARVVSRAGHLVAINPYILAEFQRTAADPARFHLIENPVDGRFFDTAPAGAAGSERLLYVGRIIPRKGILDLIAAFGRVAAARPGATLTLAGEMTSEPAYAEACRRAAAPLERAGRVRFTGGLDPDGVRDCYAGSDLVVLASLQETAPISIAEAMASGRPVVTTGVGGCAAMVEDGVTGRVVPPQQPEALAAAVEALLADPETLVRMGRAGRAAAVSRFSATAVAGRPVAVYRKLFGGEEA